jgi:hypothetical protein
VVERWICACVVIFLKTVPAIRTNDEWGGKQAGETFFRGLRKKQGLDCTGFRPVFGLAPGRAYSLCAPSCGRKEESSVLTTKSGLPQIGRFD